VVVGYIILIIEINKNHGKLFLKCGLILLKEQMGMGRGFRR